MSYQVAIKGTILSVTWQVWDIRIKILETPCRIIQNEFVILICCIKSIHEVGEN